MKKYVFFLVCDLIYSFDIHRRSTAALRNLSPTSMAAAAEAFSAATAASSQHVGGGKEGGVSSPHQLLRMVSQLESRLSNESAAKSSLEDQIAALREENQRLQEESQSAAQQLRRFTEWFFQSVENAPSGGGSGNQDDEE